MIHKCRVCGIDLDGCNWYLSYQEAYNCICKECASAQDRLARTQASRKQGVLPFNENKKCSLYLGVHVAERVLSHVFKDVERMVFGTQGYDFICNRGKKIDVKSSCLKRNGKGWMFNINRNTTADFFLCLAFDNREDLTPLHAWLIPGDKLNHITGTSISHSTVVRWDEYRLDLSKISDCCDAMR